jgi:hypothetical protein
MTSLRADPIWFYMGDGLGSSEELLCIRPHAVHVRGERVQCKQLECAGLYRNLARLLRSPGGTGPRLAELRGLGQTWFQSGDYYLAVTPAGVYVQQRLLERHDAFTAGLYDRLCQLVLRGFFGARLPSLWLRADRERALGELPDLLEQIDVFVDEVSGGKDR